MGKRRGHGATQKGLGGMSSPSLKSSRSVACTGMEPSL